MRKNITTVIASVLCVCVLLTTCSEEKEDTNKKKEHAKSSGKQSIQLPYSADIPTMDVTKATDGESMNVMRNVFEGMYTLGERNKPVPGVAKSVDVSGDSILEIMQSGLMERLLQQMILYSHGDVL